MPYTFDSALNTGLESMSIWVYLECYDGGNCGRVELVKLKWSHYVDDGGRHLPGGYAPVGRYDNSVQHGYVLLDLEIQLKGDTFFKADCPALGFVSHAGYLDNEVAFGKVFEKIVS